MCTHYALLENVQEFMLGQPTSKEFNDALGAEDALDWQGMGLTLKHGKRKIMEWTGLSKKTETGEEAKEEL